MHSLTFAAVALPVLASTASAASLIELVNRQDNATEDGMVEDGMVDDEMVQDGQEFTAYSDVCLTADEWAGYNPASYDDFFDCFTRIENDDGTAELYINGVPNHVIDADAFNPNPLCQKAEKITLPAPVKTDNNTRVPQGDLIAIAVNGVKIFGPVEGGGANAVVGADGQSVLCDGHPQPAGVWHYHHPNVDCVEAASTDLVAWSLDGFPIYGPLDGTKDEVDAILDDCNGIDVEDSEFGYQYHVRSRDQVDETLEDNDGENNTDNWKYFLGCYRGESYNTMLEEDTGYCVAETTTTSASTNSTTSTATAATATSTATTTSDVSSAGFLLQAYLLPAALPAILLALRNFL